MGYPIWELPISGGVLMGVVAIAHVVVSHFAIGGGLLIALAETVGVRRGDEPLRQLAKRSSFLLILVSTVFGAISGVGIWVVAGLLAPAGISSLIHTFVWAWAIEWTFFAVEIAAALLYWATWDRVSHRLHIAIGWVYFVAAYLSLVVINGIVTFMLTPGEWLSSRSVWDGFFNPTYWPALVLRSGLALMMASVFMAFAARRAAPADRPRLLRFLGVPLAIGSVTAYYGVRWWESALPDDVRSLFLGDSPLLATLAQTRHLALWSVTVALALALLLLVALPRAARTLPLVVTMLAAFTFFGAYERLREGVRKPFLIHGYQLANGVLLEDLPRLREDGFLVHSGWARHLGGDSDDLVAQGNALFRAQCASCHTLDGYQAIRPLLPDDPDMVASVLFTLYDQADSYMSLSPGEPLELASLSYPFMPPFAGNEEEMEALAAYLSSIAPPAEPSDAGVEGAPR